MFKFLSSWVFVDRPQEAHHPRSPFLDQDHALLHALQCHGNAVTPAHHLDHALVLGHALVHIHRHRVIVVAAMIHAPGQGRAGLADSSSCITSSSVLI